MCSGPIITSTLIGLMVGGALGFLCCAILSINRGETSGQEAEPQDSEKTPERAA